MFLMTILLVHRLELQCALLPGEAASRQIPWEQQEQLELRT